ncbi:MAG TPA: DUF1214 domain-containing protein [Acidimicrobiales bacterium]|nr:DUF1214 domain-containing protein [Acidimicrobiales bacterium]HXZ63015.1 DUF1214 domain-containing protein [Acidimicrobiales bacterium]
MSDGFVNPSWMPHSVSEAARGGDATAHDLISGRAWSHLLDSLQRAANVVRSDAVSHNAVDMAAGFRHLLVLVGIGIDQALRAEPDPVLAVTPSNVDNVFKWGMDCPDCIYTGSSLHGGETYHLWGNRGSARYVGLQSMAGMASSANVLLDELDLGPAGEVDLVLSAEDHEGNWLPIAENATTLVVRHFFYDWDTEVASSLHIERTSASAGRASRPAMDPRAVVARQVIALGDFVGANLDFFLQFSRPETPNTFLPPLDGTSMGAAAENRPVIGSWELGPDEALLIEVEPPAGLYWSFSLGNAWWETIDYAKHQSSLNGHQASIDEDGIVRLVVAHRDPGVANWLDTAGHSAGPVILRCVRTETAPVPSTRRLPFGEIGAALPEATRRVTESERAQVIAARRRAVAKRFRR